MIKSYLTESLLKDFLIERFYNYEVIHNKYFSKTYKFRPDFHIFDLKLIIEFDGYLHYNCIKTIDNDLYKNEILKSLNYKIIRIPYFVQLDEKIVSLLFKDYIKDLSTFNEYPHGFIDKKALLPYDFNYLGLEKFKNDLIKFSIIKNDILLSLNNIKLKNIIPISFKDI